MIYPVGQKPILEHPYYELYQLFRQQRWTTLVAIGYSFRDDPINKAIIERMNTAPPPPSKLIVVNTDTEDAVQNLDPPTADINNRIIRINMPFGDNDNLFDKIYAAMGCKDWKEFQRNNL